MRPLRVAIVGAGIGGLCLAQGLHRAGVDVTVHERRHARDDWLQGYRIHVNPHGSRALRDCLPPQRWAAFLGTVSVDDGGFGFVTEDLRDLLVVDQDLIGHDADPANRHHGVSRITLRQVLLDGLEGVVRYGEAFERYEPAPGGAVTAHFAGGGRVTTDLLVGADGANSRVRGQLLPHARRVDTGVLAVAGKHRLAGADLPAALTQRANCVLPVGPGFLFTAVWTGDRGAAPVLPGIGGNDPALPAGPLFDNTADYTFWAYADAARRFPPAGRLDALTGAELGGLVGGRIERWHPALRRLVAGSDPQTVHLVRVRSAAPVRPWPTGPVTLLGDAIHNMTPMAGVGANTALRDADLLRRGLAAVARGEAALGPVVREYERRMLDYGFTAVRQSLRNARQAGSANPLGRRAFRAVLRAAEAAPPLKRRMFAGFGT